MRFIVMPLAISLAACGTVIDADDGLSPELAAALEASPADAEASDGYRRSLTWDLVTPPAWGGEGTWHVTGANAGETVHIAWSAAGTGLGPCPIPLGGVCLDIVAPVNLLGTVTADANGEADVTVALPATGGSGAIIHTQAMAVRGVNTIVSPPSSDAILDQDDFVHFPGAVDMLFVVDNSCSMADEQDDLNNAFPTLLDSLLDLGLDFHIGVISTDMDDPNHSGILREEGGDTWIDASDPDPELTFSNMADLGTSGSAIEKGRDAVFAALETLAFTDNIGFRRFDSQLAVVVLSDEDDSSTGSVADFSNWLSGEVNRPSDLTFSSIVGPNLGCATASDGQGYYDVTTAVGGVFHSICDTNYDAPMADLADLFWTSVPYELSAVADEATISISASEFGGPYIELAAEDWAYDPIENTVRLTSSYHPPGGTDLAIKYLPL